MRVLSALTVAFILVSSQAPAVLAQTSTVETLSFDKKLKLAKAGDEEAMLVVARAYEDGIDTERDAVEAAKWYRKVGELGNLDAQFRLGRLLQEGAPELKKNPEGAFKLYEGAAKQGHVEAQNWLGYCYQHGIGVEKNAESAMLWYGRAAEAGLAQAENNLGLMYLNSKGEARDLKKAFSLFERAAEQGDGWGLNNLGGMYEMGWGVDEDKQKALSLYKQSEEKGNSRAKENFERLTALLAKGDTPEEASKTGSTVTTQPLDPPKPATQQLPAPNKDNPPAAVDDISKTDTSSNKSDGSGPKTDGSESAVPTATTDAPQDAVKSDSSAN